MYVRLCLQSFEIVLPGISSHRRNGLCLAAAATVLLSLVRLLMEVIQFVGWYVEDGALKPRLRKAYFKDWTNWVEVPLFIASIIFVLAVVVNECVCPAIWQWQLGTVVIFFAWIDLLTFLYKFPKFGVYLLMMQHIVQKFVRVIAIAFLFSLAFGFAFYMTFYDPNVPVRKPCACIAHNSNCILCFICRPHHLLTRGWLS